MTKRVKIGDNVKVTKVDAKGWRTVHFGEVSWIDSGEGSTGLVVVAIKSMRIEHVDHPERGRTLHVSSNIRKDTAFELADIEVVQ